MPAGSATLRQAPIANSCTIWLLLLNSNSPMLVAVDQVDIRVFPGAYDEVRIFGPGWSGRIIAPPAPRSLSSATSVDCVSGVK